MQNRKVFYLFSLQLVAIDVNVIYINAYMATNNGKNDVLLKQCCYSNSVASIGFIVSIQWVISLFGLVFRSAETLVYSQAARSKFLLIIMAIYMPSNIYYYYTKGERSDADE